MTIVQYEAHGTVVAAGAPIRQAVIAVFRVRDGQILSYRDYINPLPLMDVNGPTGVQVPLASVTDLANYLAQSEQTKKISSGCCR